jgi:hypothetical protein
MLNNEFLPAVANYLNIDEMWFQHDGAPAHYSIVACNWLDEHFSHLQFGCRGPFPITRSYSSGHFPLGQSKE